MKKKARYPTSNDEQEKTKMKPLCKWMREEKPPDAEPDITLEDTKTQLKRSGPKYAEEHSQRVFEERLTGKHTREDLTAKLNESTKQIATLLKHNEEQKAEIIANTQKAVQETIDAQMNEMNKLFEKNLAESNRD